MTYDALILGGGPAGATAALLLARAGWSVAVVEKAAFPRRKVCGEFVSATSLPLFEALGLGAAFAAAAGPVIRRLALFARDAAVTSPMPRGAAGGRALGREHLDLMLLTAAERAGAQLFQPCTAVAVTAERDTSLCTIATSGRRIALRGRIVIAASGSWERSPFLAPPAHAPHDLLGFKAHLDDADLPSDLMPLLVFPGGYGGLVTSDSGRVSLSCCIRRDALQAARARHPGASAGESVLRHIVASCVGARDVLGGARLHDKWLSAGPIRPGIRRAAHGVFFAGNLAGEAHPIIAEGISMALQSASLLTTALTSDAAAVLAGPARAAAARAYTAAWRRAFAPRLRAAALFAAVATRPAPAAAVLPAIARCPGLLTFGARLAGKARQVVPAA